MDTVTEWESAHVAFHAYRGTMESERTASAPSDGSRDGVPRARPLHGRTSGPTRRSTKGQWTAEEDEILRKAVERFKGKNWKKIAECFKDRTDVQCLHRWQKVLNPELVKGPWSKEEDEIIVELVNKYGPKKWSTIAQHLPGRIGKQCRERWHNHLNPAINKEAWTQEEELALIRAHQIYGNRWAELTKFLPGRTDNAIKNHWNSSVKKKLDTYLASGLLAQFPALPHVGFQNQLVASSSSRLQTSGVDTGNKCGVEPEENSECSQSSTVGCSQSTNDMAVGIPKNEESALGRDHNSSPVSCSEQYYPSMDDVNLAIPDVHPEICGSSNLVHHDFSCGNETSLEDYKFSGHDLPNSSFLDFGPESSGAKTESIGASESHGGLNIPFQTSLALMVPSVGSLGIGADQLHQILISDDECCRFLFSDAMADESLSSENIAKESIRTDVGGCIDALIGQSSNFQLSESSQLYDPSGAVAVDTSCAQPSNSAPLLFSSDGDAPVSGSKTSQYPSFDTQEDFETGMHSCFVIADNSANSPCDNGMSPGMLEHLELPPDQSKLVPVNAFGSGSDVMQTTPSKAGPGIGAFKQEPGSLCYEPPRFPSMDIPFFSCDLIQPTNDMQQEYSPLGIRQLMMSSINCISPFRLWDSPSRDKSPDAVLKSAAKTFTSTPSILKKRCRDLLSPLSDRRIDKKLEKDITSDLTRDFSRLDVMFDEADTQRAYMLSPLIGMERNLMNRAEDKENLCIGSECRQEKNDRSGLPGNKSLEDDCSRDNYMKEEQQTVNDDIKAKTGVEADATTESVPEPPDVLTEHDINDLLLFSPDQTSNQAHKATGSTDETPRRQSSQVAAPSLTHGVNFEFSSGNSCQPLSSPASEAKRGSHKVAKSTLSLPSGPLEITVDNALNDASFENSSIFGGTPFRRIIESPSAWKSPWFINSFLPGPRIGTEITVEDIGYFMSPGDRSYDALGLMKHLSEQSAATFATAQEVLGNDTPETVSKKKNINHQNPDQENCKSKQQMENCSSMGSALPVERRTLDFSECGTPGKPKENGKSSIAMSFSSPSSYLLKGCR